MNLDKVSKAFIDEMYKRSTEKGICRDCDIFDMCCDLADSLNDEAVGKTYDACRLVIRALEAWGFQQYLREMNKPQTVRTDAENY